MVDADMNVFCDNTPDHLEPSTTPTLFPYLAAFITVNGCVITSKIKQCLRNNYTNSDRINHIHTKTGLTISNMNLIDWDNLRTALERQ
eukprot:2097265-Ditylum_brightwellii.AAC.1